jgi:hypothetical protein
MTKMLRIPLIRQWEDSKRVFGTAGKSAGNLVDRAVGMTVAEIAKIAGQWL